MTLFFRYSFFTALAAISLLAFLPDYSALPPIVSISDLLNHTFAFTVLTLLYYFSYSPSAQRIFSNLLLYGIFIELVQAFLPTRCASVEDIAADSIGLVIGIALSKWLKVIFPAMGEKV